MVDFVGSVWTSVLGASTMASFPAPAPALMVLAVQSVGVMFMAVSVIVSAVLLLVPNVGLWTGAAVALVGRFGGST